MRVAVAVAGILGVGASALAALLARDATATEAADGLLHWQNAEVVAEGAALYDANCAACHGFELEGQPDWQVRLPNGRLPAPPHDRTGHTWHHPDALLIEITTHGTAALVGDGYESDMLGFGDILSEDEIIAVLSYIKSTWPSDVIAIHDDINERFASQ